MFLESKKVFYENNEVDPIEIYKYLPKLDCKKCRYQSCLSFAIMLAKGEANINKGNEYNLKKVKSYVKML